MTNKTITSTRRERQKLATREGILSSALEIARTEGWAAVTVRRVAELVEYTPPIIYQYFANKGAMLEELQEQGFKLLSVRLQSANSEGEDARERILRICDAYVCFAYDQPELYELMHGWNSSEVPLDKTLLRGSYVSEVVEKSVETWAAAQNVVLPDAAAAVEIGWGLTHGLISVEMLGRLRGGKERVRELTRQAIKDLLAAWATKHRTR